MPQFLYPFKLNNTFHVTHFINVKRGTFTRTKKKKKREEKRREALKIVDELQIFLSKCKADGNCFLLCFCCLENQQTGKKEGRKDKHLIESVTK